MSLVADDDRDDHGPLVVGIGASAGGLEAFKRLITELPPESGMAYVLVPHLDPTHESLMSSLLAKYTAMPVIEASDKTRISPNHVYLIPPNKYMTIKGNILRLTGPVERSGPQTSIDIFLRSLAEEKGEKAICIILSGTGSHGTLGLSAVKGAGGLTIVQDPATATYPSMPQSAIATGMVDWILPPEKISEALLGYTQHHLSGRSEEHEVASDAIHQILAFIRVHAKLDFRSYRKKMLLRRIERRMSLCRLHRLDEYLAHLRDHPAELKLFVRDLLISVTTFFRDPEAWAILESTAIVPLVHSKESDSTIRIWSAGCATGEEAYTLGILISDQLAAVQKMCPVQIFASDIDDAALDIARQAIYPDSIAADVSPERLSRYFVRNSGNTYQVQKQLREIVIFAHQNLINDAPFSKLDIIVCRNLLIYLEPETQKRVLALLHFALAEGGYLFLGPSETIGRNIDLFEPISTKWRIYRRIGHTRSNSLQFPIAQFEPRHAPLAASGRPEVPQRLAELAQKYLLKRISLACVVITRSYEVLQFAGPTDDYLTQPPGPPTHDLLALARPGLESKLRMIIQRAIRENRPQALSNVTMTYGNTTRNVRIEVEPARGSNQIEGMLLVSFQSTPFIETGSEAKREVQLAESDVIRQLEQELESTREDLQCSIEELESSNEELKASNEEVMSMNEELQSTNEELETSKEELQSLNEELNTVNNQLQDKVEDLESTNNDMANLLNCTEIATIFLDSTLRIKRFTPASTKLFKLIPTDVGRPLSDITRSFDDDRLFRDVESIMHDLISRDNEVRTDDDHWYLRRVLPYRTLDNRIDGVVITFIDITDRKQAADAITRRLAAIVEHSIDAIYCIDPEWTILTWNQGAVRLYEYTAQEALGRSKKMLIPSDKVEEWSQAMQQISAGHPVEHLETERLHKDGHLISVSITASPIFGWDDKLESVSIVVRDISDQKAAAKKLIEREERLKAILDTVVDSIITIDFSGTIQTVNPATEQMFGYSPNELIGQNVKTLMPAPYRDEHDGYLQRYLQTGEKRIIGIGREVEGRRKDGTIFPLELAVSQIDHLNLFAGILHDVTERKRLEREIIESASLQQSRIGRELHDRAGQELAAVSLLADSLLGEKPMSREVADEVVRKLKSGISRLQVLIRHIAFGLVTSHVASAELAAALKELAKRIEETFGITCTCVVEIPAGALTDIEANHLYCVAIEACNNACKHADPHRIDIRLRREDNQLTLEVVDDGCGFDPESEAFHEGLGFRIMKQRAGIILALLHIESTVPHGTKVTCSLRRSYGES